MSSSRRSILLAGLVVAIVALGTVGILVFLANEGSVPPRGEAAPPPQVSSGPTFLERTVESESASVEVKVAARMPSDFDDGQPRRRFGGQGRIDFEQDAAAVDLRLGSVPNSLGYLGHVNGVVHAVYSDTGFFLTHPVLARVAPDELEWVRYELDDLSHPHVVDLGLGQLREIGLADPRLGLALLHGASSIPEANSGEVTVALEDAAATASEQSQAALENMKSHLGLSSIDLRYRLDDEGRIMRLAYGLRYPPAPGSKKVSFNVSFRFSGFGEASRVRTPDSDRVLAYSDYLSL